MTIGVGAFLPSAAFAYPRSYVYRLGIATYTGETISASPSSYLIHAAPPVTTFIYMGVDVHFNDWSSNSYLLKNFLTDFYAETPPSMVRTPLNYTLSYALDPIHHEPALLLEWYFLTPTFVMFDLPIQPSDYWLPKPLP